MNAIVNITVFTLLLPILGFCQSNFSIGANISPRINKLKVTESNAFLGETGEFGLGYSLGIQFQINLSKNLFIRNAVNYQQINHKHKEYRHGFALSSPDDPLPIKKRNIHVSSIEFPLDIGYLIRSKNGKYNFPIGIRGTIKYNLDMESDVILSSELYGERILPDQKDEINFANYSVAFFGGIEIGLNKKMILGIEPLFILTPNKFIFGITDSIAKTEFETGLTIRIRSN